MFDKAYLSVCICWFVTQVHFLLFVSLLNGTAL